MLTLRLPFLQILTEQSGDRLGMGCFHLFVVCFIGDLVPGRKKKTFTKSNVQNIQVAASYF